MPHLQISPLDAAADLRARAHSHLKTGGGPVNRDATEVLRVLFELASFTETAGDALALLHELQLHQIELDMQTQELKRSREALEEAFDQQQLLQDHAPSAQLVLDAQAQVVSLNVTAQGYWPGGRASVVGSALALFWSPASQAAWSALCQSARLEGWPVADVLHLQVPGQSEQAVCVSVRPHPAQPGWLVHWLTLPARM